MASDKRNNIMDDPELKELWGEGVSDDRLTEVQHALRTISDRPVPQDLKRQLTKIRVGNKSHKRAFTPWRIVWVGPAFAAAMAILIVILPSKTPRQPAQRSARIEIDQDIFELTQIGGSMDDYTNPFDQELTILEELI